MKTYTGRLFAVLILVLFGQPLLAQFGTGKPDKMKLLRERPLIVILETESQHTLALLQKKKKFSQAERYRQAVADYNANLKDAVNRFWTFNRNITFMTYDEAHRLFKEKSTYYSVLFCANVENFKLQGQKGGRMHSGLAWSKIYDNANEKRDFWDTYTVMQVRLIEELNVPDPVYSQNLANIIPEVADLAFGLHALQYYAADKTGGRTAKTCTLKDVAGVANEKLAGKTLLLKEDWVNASLSNAVIKSNYPYAFEVLDNRTFNTRVLEADSSHAYIQIVPEVTSARNQIKIHYLHLIIDAADGAILGVSTPGFTDKGKMITKANLKDYAHSGKKL